MRSSINTNYKNKQPDCLPVLFLTEMWERFGFYIVQVLLIFYLIKVYHFSDKLSAAILGAFTAISYITPVAGGYLADRFLGYKHSIILGGLLLSFGYALLAMQQDTLFYLALATIAIGTGFFKPNISSYLGNFYEKSDSRCERGYTLFYIGINVGIVLATTSSGYILNFFGWRANFIVASIGLLIAIVTFIYGLHYLESKGRLITLRKIELPSLGKVPLLMIYLATFSSIYFFSLVIKDVALANIVFIVGATAMILTLLVISYRSSDKGKMFACLLLISLSTLFWALYYQLFFALNLFIDRVLDRSFMGHELPSPLFISMMPIFIMLFGSSIGWIWQTLESRNRNISTTLKFSLSLFCMAAGLLLLVLGTQFPNSLGLVNKSWVIIAYLLFALAELLISPICIAMVITMVPAAYIGMMMGAYLAAIGFGAKLAGVIAGMAAIPKSMTDTAMIINVYQHAFMVYTGIAIAGGLIILASTPVISWLTKKDKETDNNEEDIRSAITM